MAKKMTLAVIAGNRGFFPDHLVAEGRKEVLAVLAAQGYKTVCLTPKDTPFGSVETRPDAHKCADLFKAHADEIDGVLVTLPNFGDERAIADTLRMAGLNVPVLVQAFPDDAKKMGLADRRDSFCGKISACNNLTQYGIKYSLTGLHTVAPGSAAFKADLDWFAAVCRVVRGLKGARIGAIGARPAAFNTVRYSEKILEASGVSVEVIDLGEVMGLMAALDEKAAGVKRRLAKVKEYTCVDGVPEESLMKMAKLATIIDEWMEKNELVASAVQCWTAIEEYVGIVPCTVMSMMSEKLMPSACEVDVTGAVGMYALTLAGGMPAALLDWNNNYGEDPDKCVLFHCSNAPKSCFANMSMSIQDIIGASVGNEKTYGACTGRFTAGPMTYARISTDDENGMVAAYVGEGEMTDDKLDTFGGVGVAMIPNLQGLLRYICVRGFEHHVAVSKVQVAKALTEAMGNYMEWDVYHHGG